MPAGQEPIVTNICSELRRSGGGAGCSAAVVQATAPVKYALAGRDSLHPTICLAGVRTHIPDGAIGVYDGLLDRIDLVRSADGICLTLDLAHPTALSIRAIPGLPAVLDLTLDRRPLWRIMHGRRILVDPGHGGEDAGGRGPVDLLEKKMTLAAARHLAEELAGLGAEGLLTRSDDTCLTLRERFALAGRCRIDALVSLHTAWFLDPSVAGLRVVWLNRSGQDLARRIHRALRQKLPLPDRGLAEGPPLDELAVPSAAVEFATISNPVEEGWLRSATFLKRTAAAVANGLKDFFAAGKPGL